MEMTGHAPFSCFTQMRSFVCHTTVHITETNQNSSPRPVIGMQTENCITRSFQIAGSKGRINEAVIREKSSSRGSCPIPLYRKNTQ